MPASATLRGCLRKDLSATDLHLLLRDVPAAFAVFLLCPATIEVPLARRRLQGYASPPYRQPLENSTHYLILKDASPHRLIQLKAFDSGNAPTLSYSTTDYSRH